MQAQNANYAHKQRQLSYSPNMHAAPRSLNKATGQKKQRNVSEAQAAGPFDQVNFAQVPDRRSQSKTDKYNSVDFQVH